MGKNKYFFDFDSLDGFIYFINYNKINIGLPLRSNNTALLEVVP